MPRSSRSSPCAAVGTQSLANWWILGLCCQGWWACLGAWFAKKRQWPLSWDFGQWLCLHPSVSGKICYSVEVKHCQLNHYCSLHWITLFPGYWRQHLASPCHLFRKVELQPCSPRTKKTWQVSIYDDHDHDRYDWNIQLVQIISSTTGRCPCSRVLLEHPTFSTTCSTLPRPASLDFWYETLL